MVGARRPILLGATLLASGVAFSAVSLLVPGVGLLLLVVGVGLWASLSSLRAGVRRKPLPSRVTEGVGFEVEFSLRSGWLPLVATLIDPALGRSERIRLLRPRREIDLRLEGMLGRRGSHRLEAPALRLVDPLGIVSREIAGRGASMLLVLPRVEPIIVNGGGGGRAGGLELQDLGSLSRSHERESASEAELDGLRPYRAGTPASRIYWPGLARGDELLERRLSPPGGGGPRVVLDAAEPIDPKALDRAVRAAASLCFHLGKRGGCELLLPAMRRSLTIGANLEFWPEAHAALALVEADHGAPGAFALTGDGPLFWVSARPAGSGLPPAARGYLVTAAGLPGRSPAFAVAGCAAFPLQRDRRAGPRLKVAS